MHDVKIRAVRAGDAAAVAALAEELGYPTAAEEMAPRITALASSPEDAVFVAVLGLTPVAWIHVACVTLLESPRYAEIRGLVVTSSLRGRGIGKRIFLELLKIAHNEGCGRFEWSVLDWNQPAIDFYERLGAKPQGEWIRYRLDQDQISTLAQSGLAPKARID